MTCRHTALILLTYAILAVFAVPATGFFFGENDPETGMNVKQILEFNGYPCEEHEVLTDDGYVLTLFRIPFSSKETYPGNQRRPAVFLQHGLLDSAHTWIMNVPEQSLAYILADAGFDVWLGNSRGNTYSRRHAYLSTRSSDFWAFSWQHMAKFDVPACVNYVLRNSGNEKLAYIGHSQGSLTAFAQFSEDQALASRISSFSALGPVTTVGHLGLTPRLTITAINTASLPLQLISHGEFLPTTDMIKSFSAIVCTKAMLSHICYNPIFWLAGFDINNLNISRVDNIVSHTPAGTSVQNLKHFYQMTRSKRFQRYDFGSRSKNEYQYGTGTPPRYNVSRLTVPLALYWGGQDILATPTDVRALFPLVYRTLRTHKFISYYNHMDYLWGMDAHRVLYPDLIAFIRQHL